jgi:SAM-dependent MidA family methyltransferase
MTRSEAQLTLPALSAAQRAHSEALRELIRTALQAAGGWLPFERFMELALYAPGYGYYSAGGTKFGAAGDFVTAPEISDLFSHCVASQCAQVLHGNRGDIIEFGAGTGRMACYVLQTLQELGTLPERYCILEVSADLAARQRERVSQLAPELQERVCWLSELPREPWSGIILANEVLDAFPCSRFLVAGGHTLELGVTWRESSFVWSARDGEFADGDQLLAGLRASPDEGYVSELCRSVGPWIHSLADKLQYGVALLFDYGLPRAQYYHPQRASGTLQCHFRQRAHDDPFINIGLQDITAWVDFTRVAEAAVDAGLTVCGFATQAAFLLGNGIMQHAMAEVGSIGQLRYAAEARRLLLPGEMGESFKVMALGRGVSQSLQGFTHQDLRPSL